MVRALGVALSLMVGGVLATPVSALACGADCGCDHKKAPAKDEKDAAKDGANKSEQQANDQQRTKASSARSSVIAPINAAIAAKCSCHGQSDCTCKKGQCKCAKCGAKHGLQHQMIEAVGGKSDALTIPANARLDARAGMFI